MSDVQDIKQAIGELNGPPGSQPVGRLRPQTRAVASGLLLVGRAAARCALDRGRRRRAEVQRPSVVTVGVLTGIMFLLFALEEFALAAIDRSARWLWVLSGIILAVGGVLALIRPTATFAGFADILGFVFVSSE